MKKIFLFIFILISAGSAFGQQVEDYLNKIELKLNNDKNYLNLHYVTFNADSSNNIFGTELPKYEEEENFSFKLTDNIQYRLVFLKEGIGIEKPQLLYLDEIDFGENAGEGFFTAVNNAEVDTNRVLGFKDVYNLELNHKEIYNGLFSIVENYLSENDDESVPSLLGIHPETEIKTGLGVSSRDNSDYLAFARLNESHWYPKEEISSGFSRRGTGSGSPLRLDLSFSRLSLSHKVLDFSLGGTSVEASATERVLNLLPYQSRTLSTGFRTLLKLGDYSDINKSTYLDAKFMARIKMNTNSFIKNLSYIQAEKSLLNVGSSIIAELNVTRPMNLPFINMYLSTGNKNYDDPLEIIENNGANYAYFSFTQAEFTMSFYWNTTDKLESKFKMDLGAGFFDISRAYYDDENNVTSEATLQNTVSPVIAIHYNFVPQGNAIFGTSVKYFNAQFNSKIWLKLLELNKIHTLRLETLYISSPVGREMKEWENEGGVMFQLRYRYGL